MTVEEAFRDGVKKFVDNINIIVLLTTWLTILALFGISIGMISTHHNYPWLAAYCMLVSITMGMIEVGADVILRFNSGDTPWLEAVQMKMEEFLRWINPIKKCIIYIVLSLALFVHFTVATVGGLLVMLTAFFLAVQVKLEPATGNYSTLRDENEGPISGISAGDVILPGSQGPAATSSLPGSKLPSTAGDAFPPDSQSVVTEEELREVSPTTGQEWDVIKDENLLIG